MITKALTKIFGSRNARLLKGMQRGRLQVSDATLARGIRAALEAGWDPTSRGKPMVFMVDADGN